MSSYLITCPKCKSQYYENNEEFKEGVLVRCCVCENVWRLEEETLQHRNFMNNEEELSNNEEMETIKVAKQLFKKELSKEELLTKLPLKNPTKEEPSLEAEIIKNKSKNYNSKTDNLKSTNSKIFNFLMITSIIANLLFWTVYFLNLNKEITTALKTLYNLVK